MSRYFLSLKKRPRDLGSPHPDVVVLKSKDVESSVYHMTRSQILRVQAVTRGTGFGRFADAEVKGGMDPVRVPLTGVV